MRKITYALCAILADARFSGDFHVLIKFKMCRYSVGVFCGCALVCIAVLVFRQKYCGGMLGGEFVPKVSSGVLMIGLWFVYIAMSIVEINRLAKEAEE